MSLRSKVLILVCGIAVVLLLFSTAGRDAATSYTEKEPASLTTLLELETESVAHLHQHHHGNDDEVSDRGHGVVVETKEIVIENDMWVSGLRVEVVNAPRSTLHHANIRLYLPSSPLLPSPLLQFKNMFGLSLGQDIAETLSLPAPYAIFIPQGSHLSGNVMLHNPLPPNGPGGNYDDVSVKLSLLGDAEPVHTPVVPISIALIDETSHGNDSFVVPANNTHYVRTPEATTDIGRGTYTFPTNGMLVELGAHMHAWQGAKQVDVFLNNEKIHTFVSTLGENTWDWFTPHATLYKEVQAGDVLWLSAVYENNSTEPIVGAMAMVGASFAPEDPLKELLLSF